MQANFVSLSAMLANAKSPMGLVDTMDEEQLAANYGRAALHGLVELAPPDGDSASSPINREYSALMFFRILDYPWN